MGLGRMPYNQSEFRALQRVGAPGALASAGAQVFVAACGCHHTVVLIGSCAVWTCGNGGNRELGHGGLDRCYVPTRMTQAHFGGSRIVSVAVAGTTSMAVTAEGMLYSWGTDALGHGAMD